MKAMARAATRGAIALRTLGQFLGITLVEARDRVAEVVGGEDLVALA